MIIGIDLGTTNSLAAIWRDGVELVPNSLGRILTPSIVSLDRSGEVLVGAAALERMVSHPDQSAAAFKRYMGTSRSIPLGARSFRPEELSSFVLRSLKADAEAFLGEGVDEAVVTVPAYFSDAQRKATRIAGELAGLKVERVLNEPTAAALAYGLQDREAASRDGSAGKILVFDLGGGTFDVSILEVFEGIMEVRATAGDNYLGGEDFDDAILAWFAEATGTNVAQAGGGAVAAARLRRLVERARRRLDDHDEAEIALPHDGGTLAATLTTATFARLSAPLLERLRRPVQRAMRDGRIRPAELSQVVLVGGATRMPIVRRLVATLFERLPLQRINPDEVVARGAAVQAALKMRHAALRDVVLTDVAPYTLGIEIVERAGAGSYASGRFLPVIERNSVVPVSRVKQVGPTADFQTAVEIRIFQGESRLVKDNIRLGSLRMALKPRRAAEQAIDVRFTYDVNGILEVSAKSLHDGALERLVIEENPGVLAPDEVAARLDALNALKVHPRDQAPNRLLLAEAERLFEESLGERRSAVGQEIARFEAALASQAPEVIAPATERLAALLRLADGAGERDA